MPRNLTYLSVMVTLFLWGSWLVSRYNHVLAQVTPPNSVISQASNTIDFASVPNKIDIIGQGIPLGTAIPIATDLEGVHSVNSADFDHDGDQDLVAVSRIDGKVIWLENNGNYTPEFTLHQVAIVNGVYAVTVSDINDDGAMDFAIAAVGEVRPSEVSDELVQASASTAQQGNGMIIWYANNHASDPTFTAHTVITTLAYPVSIQSADVDRDGDVDLLSASRDGNRVIWYESNGAETPDFTPHVINNGANGAVSVHFGDINRDGYLDIVSASENDDTIMWYQNNGAQPPAFTHHIIRQNLKLPPDKDYAKSVFVADVDSDGDADIVYGSEGENEVGWYENDGAANPSFVKNVVTDRALHAKYVMAIDLDRDGDIDLMSASSDDDVVAWYENNGASDPLFSRHVIDNNATGARYVHVTDLNGDGDLDLLGAARKANILYHYPNRTIHRSAVFPAATELVSHTGARHLIAADMDNDGDMDVVTIAGEHLMLHENQGTQPPSYNQHTITTEINGARWVQAGDLDSDGDLDLVSASKKDNRIAWYENDGASPPGFFMRNISTSAIGARSAGIADMNNDGVLDVYSASDEDDKVAWYENNRARPPGFTEHVVSRQADYVRSVYAADLDSDGDMDLMSASQRDNKVAWYRNIQNDNGQTHFETYPIDTTSIGAQHIHADDIDNDGDQDIVVASEHDNTVAWYENNGADVPIFQKNIISNQAKAVHAVYTGDADQDGDIDVFAAIEGNHTIAWYENNGQRDPTFVYHVVAENALVAHGIWAADLDGDGDLDMMSAARNGAKFSWYQNQGGQYKINPQRVGPEQIPDGQTASILQIDTAHKGRGGDSHIRLNQLDLQFTSPEGAPLNTDQANRLMTQLRIYRSSDEHFNPDQDQLVGDVNSITLDANGIIKVPLASNTSVTSGNIARYIVVPTTHPQASQQIPSRFQVVVRPSLQAMQDNFAKLPLRGELMGDNIVVIPEPPFDPTPYLQITEFMASNSEGLPDPDEPEEYPDWFELYNSWTEPIDLGGLFLSDNLEDPIKYQIPEGVMIPSNGYLVFYADNESEQGPLHTNFKLRWNGESIGLFNHNVKPIDTYTYEIQYQNMSFGRHPNSGEWVHLGVATPGTRNLLEPLDHHIYFPWIPNQR